MIHCKKELVGPTNGLLINNQSGVLNQHMPILGICYDNYVIVGPTVILLDQQIFADLTKHTVQMTQNM